MNLLLDTHVFLAIIENRVDTLSSDIRRLLAEPTGQFHISVATLWEIAIKSRLGKLRLSTALRTLPELIESMAMMLLPFNEHHALAAIEPEVAARDPFDRMLLAQCQVERLRLVTIDRALVAHPLAVAAP